MGAGGRKIVDTCTRLYESVVSALEHRDRKVLLHTALVIHTGLSRKVIECAWPTPDDQTAARGAVVVGPVFTYFLGRFRPFRYEIRCWENGTIPDLDYAMGCQLVSEDTVTAERIVAASASVPPHRWGRDELGTDEMWNSNSVIAYALAKAGVQAMDLEPPPVGRAPGWVSGIVAAGSSRSWDHRPLSSSQ